MLISCADEAGEGCERAGPNAKRNVKNGIKGVILNHRTGSLNSFLFYLNYLSYLGFFALKNRFNFISSASLLGIVTLLFKDARVLPISSSISEFTEEAQIKLFLVY